MQAFLHTFLIQTLRCAMLACLATTLGYAQLKPTGKRDNSFTVAGSYSNEIRRYPEIQLADSTMPADVRVVRDVVYSTPEKGRELLLDIYQNKNKPSRKMPAILMVHGGGWSSGDRSHNNVLARQLADKGFVTMTADYRLSTEALFPAAVHDLKAAVRWIKANAADFGVDTSQVAVLGFSAGGELAAFIGATNGIKKYEGNGGNPKLSSNVHAVIDMDGTLAFIHPESGEGDDSKSTSAATYWFGYSKTEKPELWQEAAPLTHAGKHTPPFLFINSSVDRMHAGRTDFIAILDKNDIYNTVKSFPEAPHTFMFFDPWFKPTLQAVAAFLNHVFPADK